MLTIPCLIGAYNLEHQNAIDCILFSRCVVYTFNHLPPQQKHLSNSFCCFPHAWKLQPCHEGTAKKGARPAAQTPPWQWDRRFDVDLQRDLPHWALGVWSLGGVSVVLIFFSWVGGDTKSNRRYLGKGWNPLREMLRMQNIYSHWRLLVVVQIGSNWILSQKFWVKIIQEISLGLMVVNHPSICHHCCLDRPGITSSCFSSKFAGLGEKPFECVLGTPE